MTTPVVQLTASSGGQILATFDLIPGDYPIGRDPACSIHLASPDVSRKHAQLTVTPEGCAIEDIGGRYGTLIDNRQISGKIRIAIETCNILELLRDASGDFYYLTVGFLAQF